MSARNAINPEPERTNGNMPSNHLDLSGLSAGDAELFAGQAEAKRAGTAGADPRYRAQIAAEAHGLDALASALRDPGTCQCSTQGAVVRLPRPTTPTSPGAILRSRKRWVLALACWPPTPASLA